MSTALSKKIRCAVVGSGFAGSTHAEAICYAPEAELVAIAGGRNAPELARRYNVRAVPTDDVDRLLESDEIDAVMIASPNPFHAPQAIRAARAGKHVFVEKPMAMTVAECRAMIAAATANGVTLMPGHHHRYRRCELAIRLLLDRGAIGNVEMISMNLTEPDETTWLNNPANGGYLLGSGVHGVDLLQFWLGDVAAVTALTGRYRDVPVENGSQLLLEFGSGAHGMMQNVVIPRLYRPEGSGVVGFTAHLTGTKGAIQADMYGAVRLSTETGWVEQTSLGTWQDQMEYTRMEAYAAMAREFIRASIEQRMPLITGDYGLKSIAVVQAAHRAAAERTWVPVGAILEEG